MIRRDDPTVRVQVYLLGTVDAWRLKDGEWIQATMKEWGDKYSRSLLAYVATHDRISSYGVLLEELWPHDDHISDKRLQNTASQVRKVLGSADLFASPYPSYYRLGDQSLVWVDVGGAFELVEAAEKVGYTTEEGMAYL